MPRPVQLVDEAKAIGMPRCTVRLNKSSIHVLDLGRLDINVHPKVVIISEGLAN